MQDDEARKITKESQRNNTSAPLIGFWYSAVLSSKIKPGTMKTQTLLGMPIVICRDLQGGVAAFLDLCPHRAMPLSFGCFDGRRIECSYHGWQFDMTGTCRHIPALSKSLC
jgi:phenylpropionate dioxygenase-like ring-hydroxylating dioxygenase large terminal subunit